MASVDVGVGLLGYGTVGSAVSPMLAESGDEIERTTGHRLTVVPSDELRSRFPQHEVMCLRVAREGAGQEAPDR
jgi:homoserine dehydrogenase